MSSQEYQDFYEVEEIVGKRTYKNEVQYKVKWKGYTVCTWEPETSLESSEDLIEIYNLSQGKIQKKKQIKIEQVDQQVKVEFKSPEIQKISLKQIDGKITCKDDLKIIQPSQQIIPKPKKLCKSIRKEQPKSLSTQQLTILFSPDSSCSIIRQSQIGSFKAGDQINQIIKSRVRGKTIQFLVKWNIRKDGIQPRLSWILENKMQEHAAKQLVDYLFKKIRAENKSLI